ncbi:oligosaccharide flippase family protein [Macrococcus armenti]|uniref:oligosaccharide flippase family protein n=1 Tax=Macrococcus armenti TaxID=2875764 RepID=UPI001CCCB45D|nr:oligosaccharide flippase family protein [Macrococcus armenti]UBH09363.1 oligosaccharide flippase family protein [Macrococcus armenti]
MKEKSLIKSSLIYTFVNLFNKAIPFLLLPVLTNYLSPEEYGKITLFTLYIGLLTPFIGLNVHGAIARVYFQEDIDFKKYLSTSHSLILLSTLVSIIILTFIILTTNLLKDISIVYIFAGVIATYCNYITQLLLTVWQVNDKPIKYGLIQILKTIINFGSSITLIVIFSFGTDGRIIGILLGSFAAVGIAYRVLVKDYKLSVSVNKYYLVDMIKFGVPLIPHLLGLYIIGSIDKIFLTTFEGTEAMGIYSVAYQIALILFVFTDSFNIAWNPYLYGKLNSKNFHEINRNILLYILFLSILAIILSCFTPFIYNLFINNQYHDGIKYVIILNFAFVLNGIYKIFVSFIYYFKKTYIISNITIITSIFNLIVAYFLIKYFGTIGAPIAMLLSYALQMMSVFIAVKKYMKMIKEC